MKEIYFHLGPTIKDVKKMYNIFLTFLINKAGYTATPVACGWAGAVIEVTRSFGQEQ